MKSYLLSAACAASILLALAPAAAADEFDIAHEPQGWGWYVSVLGGRSSPQDLGLAWSDATTAYDVEAALDDGFMAGIAMGAQLNDRLRGEVELSGHWHEVDEPLAVDYYASPTDFGSFTDEAQGEVSAMFLIANLWLDLPLGGVMRPYVGGGVGIGRLDAEITATTNGSDHVFLDDSDWGFAYQLGAGVAFDMTPTIAVDLGYRFKGINAELDVAVDYFFDPALDDPDTHYRSHSAVIGLRWRL
jgi:opacity protein-like surface antigen